MPAHSSLAHNHPRYHSPRYIMSRAMSELNTGAEDVGGLRLGPDLEDEFERDEEVRKTELARQLQDAFEKQQRDSRDAAKKLERRQKHWRRNPGDDEEGGSRLEHLSCSPERSQPPPVTTPSVPPPTPPSGRASPSHAPSALRSPLTRSTSVPVISPTSPAAIPPAATHPEQGSRTSVEQVSPNRETSVPPTPPPAPTNQEHDASAAPLVQHDATRVCGQCAKAHTPCISRNS